MINRYFAPCRYCGGTVHPDTGTVEKVGEYWLTAHVPCVEAQLKNVLALPAEPSPQKPRRATPSRRS
jgi:hypothetical protein